MKARRLLARCSALIMLVVPFMALSGELHGRVAEVSDGDTLHLVDESGRTVVVRLANIDAPETSCHRHRALAGASCIERAQPYGKDATRYLAELVARKRVRVVTIEGWNASSYGRAVGTVYVGDVDANYELVVHGFAWHYVSYASRQQTADAFATYEAAQEAAKAAHRGLWVDQSPVPPWDYRHNR